MDAGLGLAGCTALEMGKLQEDLHGDLHGELYGAFGVQLCPVAPSRSSRPVTFISSSLVTSATQPQATRQSCSTTCTSVGNVPKSQSTPFVIPNVSAAEVAAKSMQTRLGNFFAISSLVHSGMRLMLSSLRASVWL